MTHRTDANVHPALAMGRTLGATILALAILIGIGGGLRPAAAAAPLTATDAVVTVDAAEQGSLVLAGHKVRKGFGFKHGHGFKKFGFKHGHGFKKYGFKHGHGFKKHGFKHGHGFKKKGFVFKHGHGFKKGYKHGHGGKVFFF